MNRHIARDEKARPAVSVILCTYDRSGPLARAIDSVLAQTFTDFELIVVDDGSSDGTADVVLPIARRDRRVVYLRHANRGLARARNAGIALACGEWVAFLDSDDIYEPDHLKVHMALVAKQPVDAVFGGIRLVGPRGLRYARDAERPGHRIHLSRCHVGGTLFVRRSVLRALRGFRELAFSEDHELMARIERRFRVGQCARPTYVYDLTGDDRLSRRRPKP